MKNKIIEVQNVQISISKQELDDYASRVIDFYT